LWQPQGKGGSNGQQIVRTLRSQVKKNTDAETESETTERKRVANNAIYIRYRTSL